MRTRLFTAVVVGLLCAGCARGASEPGLRADRVLVLKKERTLQLLRQGKVIKTYKVALGVDPVGPKTSRGDHKTPEGIYVLNFRNSHSQFARRSIFLIRVRGIVRWLGRRESRLGAMSSCTDSPTAMAMWAQLTD